MDIWCLQFDNRISFVRAMIYCGIDIVSHPYFTGQSSLDTDVDPLFAGPPQDAVSPSAQSATL